MLCPDTDRLALLRPARQELRERDLGSFPAHAVAAVDHSPISVHAQEHELVEIRWLRFVFAAQRITLCLNTATLGVLRFASLLWRLNQQVHGVQVFWSQGLC